MKNTILKLSAIAALILSANISAQETRTFWYVIGDQKVRIVDENGNLSANQPIGAYNCFDPVNIGQIGSDGECNGKLIVDNTSLLALVDSNSDYSSSAIFTGQVTSFHSLFMNKTVNYDITGWNTTNATIFTRMFYASNINQNLSNWNMQNATTLSQMFTNADNFNQPLNNWNISNVQSMYGMFWAADNFNQPLNNWNTGNVTNMSRMFINSISFNQNISNWNVSSVSIYSDFNTGANATWVSNSAFQPNFN